MVEIDKKQKEGEQGTFPATNEQSNIERITYQQIKLALSSPSLPLRLKKDVVYVTLPTSDPSDSGALWNNGGVVTVSSG